MSSIEVALFGRGLHSGALCAVRLRREPGALRFEVDGERAPLDQCRVLRTDQGVQLELAGGSTIDLVELLLAALGGLGLRDGLVVSVLGRELPLLDGGALTWARALEALALEARAPRLEVLRPFELQVGPSHYAFTPAARPSLEVEVEFDNPAIGKQSARWDGSAAEFTREIAPARTFGFERDAELLQRAGRASFVDRRAVIVLDERGETTPGVPPPRAGEFARHKLLDLIGDLYLLGGPPRGHVRALRPGHGATRLALLEALRLGGLNGARFPRGDAAALDPDQ
jgi:UDP-3-O-[3-hydroxymyristoyl] N-acetylglucosamine deacetylase